MTDEVVTDEVELDPLNDATASLEASQATEETPAEPSPAVETNDEPDAVQKRINKLTAQKYEEKRAREAAEARVAELEGVESALPSEAPKLEDFEFDESKHNAATIQYEVRKYAESQASKQSQQTADAARQVKAADFAAKEAEFGAKNPDYSETVANIPKLPTDTLDAIYALENGPQMAHYLGKHLDVADEIANASPIIAAVKLGQLAATLSANTTTVSTTSAPEPVETISGAGGVGKDLDEMSMDQIMAL